MKTGDIVRKFGVSEATVRRWASDFSEYLTPNEGRQRNFTHEDYVVMATIYELFNSGLTQKAVEKKLSEGYRIEVEDIADIGYADGRMVPVAVVEQVVDATQLRTELEQIKFERDKLLEMLEKSEQSRLEMQQSLTDKIDNLQKEIAQLQRELGRAEARAEIYQEQRNREQNNRPSNADDKS